MNTLFKNLVVPLHYQINVLCDDRKYSTYPTVVGFFKISQCILFDRFSRSWTANADTYPAILVTDHFGDRAQPVMAGVTTTDFDSYISRMQFDLVVKNRDLIK